MHYRKFKVFMFTYWAMLLAMAGMYSLYIIQKNFSKFDIGIAVTIFTVSVLIGQNLAGYMTDRLQSAKKVLLIFIGLGLVFTSTLIFSGQKWQIFILISSWGLFMYGTIPISEAWYIGVLESNGEQRYFGRIRGFGSIGYGVSAVLLGFLLQGLGWCIYKWYLVFFNCLVLLLLLAMKESKGTVVYQRSKIDRSDIGNISYLEVFRKGIKIKPLQALIIILFLYNFVVKGVHNYLGVLVSDSGGGPVSLGFTYFLDSFPEVISFFLAARLLKKLSNKRMILIAFMLQIVRLSLILVFHSPFVIMFLGVLSGIAFGLLAAVYKTYIYEISPEKYKNIFLSLSESVINLSSVVSAPVFGFVIMRFGGYASIAMGLIIEVAAAFLLLRKKDL